MKGTLHRNGTTLDERTNSDTEGLLLMGGPIPKARELKANIIALAARFEADPSQTAESVLDEIEILQGRGEDPLREAFEKADQLQPDEILERPSTTTPTVYRFPSRQSAPDVSPARIEGNSTAADSKKIPSPWKTDEEVSLSPFDTPQPTSRPSDVPQPTSRPSYRIEFTSPTTKTLKLGIGASTPDVPLRELRFSKTVKSAQSTKEVPDPNPQLTSNFRQVMRSVPAAVFLITTQNGEAAHAETKDIRATHSGMTVSSLTTVTLEPWPTISMNIKYPSRTLAAMRTENRFFVHVLANNEAGAAIADAFTKPYEDPAEPFRRVKSTTDMKIRISMRGPYFHGQGVVIVLVCKPLWTKSIEVGDHTVLLAEVRDFIRRDSPILKKFANPSTNALAYVQRSYRKMGPVIEPQRKPRWPINDVEASGELMQVSEGGSELADQYFRSLEEEEDKDENEHDLETDVGTEDVVDTDLSPGHEPTSTADGSQKDVEGVQEHEGPSTTQQTTV